MYNQRQHHHQQQHSGSHSGTPAAAAALPRTVPVTSYSLLHRAFTEVPDYGIASRGFLGGVTPLETLQGLPSYEEAEMQRSRSESDLAAMTTMTAPRGGSSASPLTPPRRPAPGCSMAVTDSPRSS